MGEVEPGEVFSWTIRAEKVPAADWSAESLDIPTGSVVKLEEFMVVDETTADKTISLGFKRAGTSYWLISKPAGTNVKGILLETPIFLVGGERLIAKVASASANDVLYAVARGLYI